MTELEKKLMNIKLKMEQCDHNFIIQSEGYWVGGFHSSDYEYTPSTVTCSKCGLTNYHLVMDPIHKQKYSKMLMCFNPIKYYLLQINDEIFKKEFHGNSINEQNKVLNKKK